MPRNRNALTHDGSMMADSDSVDFLSRSTDSSINFSGLADLHTPIHPLFQVSEVCMCVQCKQNWKLE